MELSRVVLAASRRVSTIPNTEFLGESRIALCRVENEQAVLTESERLELLDVLRQLDEAFIRRLASCGNQTDPLPQNEFP